MRRFLSSLLIVAMALTVLAGCGGSKTNEKKSTAPTQAPAEKKVYKVNYWHHSPWTRNPLPEKEKNWADKLVLDKYGIDWTLQIAPADGADAKLNAMMAGGDIPDIIVGNFTIAHPNIDQWISQGIVVPVDQYLKDFPALQKRLTDAQWQYLKRGGKTYGVGTAPDPSVYTLWIRKDWLDKLKLKMPTTAEELAAVAKAFAANDPDGNGKPDTYGVTAMSASPGWGQMDSYFAPFGAQPGKNHIYVENNTAVFSAFSPEAKAALTWWNDLVKAKAVDPDWLTNKRENWNQAVVQGRVGIVAAHFLLGTEYPSNDALLKQIRGVNPAADWVQVPAIKGPKGTWSAWARLEPNVTWFVTRKGAESPEKAKALMQLLNDMIDPSTETYRNLVWGQPNVHYEEKDGKVFARKADHPDLQWLQYYRNIRNGDAEYWKVLMAKEPAGAFDKVQFAFTQPQLPHMTGLVRPHAAMADLTKYIEEMHSKFATGTEPMANWDKFVETAMTKYRAKEAVDDATKQLKDLGLIK